MASALKLRARDRRATILRMAPHMDRAGGNVLAVPLTAAPTKDRFSREPIFLWCHPLPRT